MSLGLTGFIWAAWTPHGIDCICEEIKMRIQDPFMEDFKKYPKHYPLTRERSNSNDTESLFALINSEDFNLPVEKKKPLYDLLFNRWPRFYDAEFCDMIRESRDSRDDLELLRQQVIDFDLTPESRDNLILNIDNYMRYL